MIVDLKPMTFDNFAKFGWLLKYPEDEKPDITVPDLDYWKKPMDLSGFKSDGEFSFMRVKKREILLTMLDVLHESIEVYLSLDGRSSIFFAAPALEGNVNKPDVSKIEAFIFSGPGGFAVKTGVWHWTPYPLSHDADFVLGLRNNVLIQKDGNIEVGEGQVIYQELDEPISVNL
jgi:ureidoglycolate hydrolase